MLAAIWRENDRHVIVPQALHGQHERGEQKLVETICIVWVCDMGFMTLFRTHNLACHAILK
jgi:hypothetical protein